MGYPQVTDMRDVTHSRGHVRARSYILNDFFASIVVFFVALPLCVGIALAAGRPPATGILTGIVGGLICGSLGGIPLQISGPAAGLVVLVSDLLSRKGLGALGPIIMLAGMIQLSCGCLGLARWFRAVPPSVITGMLSAIGVLILSGQFHVMMDMKPMSSSIANILSLPANFAVTMSGTAGPARVWALLTGLSTIGIIILWQRLSKQFKNGFALIPPALIAVMLMTAIVNLMHLPINHVNVPNNLLTALKVPTPAEFYQAFKMPSNWLDAIALALIASAETLLTAAALQKMRPSSGADYNRELRAHGIANTICGALTLMPMTGVIARSGVNVNAGAKTRISAILHGVWLLTFACAFPFVINMIPTSSLAALLVYTGAKLIDWATIRKLHATGKWESLICSTTIVCIICTDLLTGVLAGLALAAVRLTLTFSRLQVNVVPDPIAKRSKISLEGAATFVTLPTLADALERVGAHTELHVHIEQLEYIDHACLDLLINYELRQKSGGGSLVINWDDLQAVFKKYSKGGSSAKGA